jgi:hypothetical protein
MGNPKEARMRKLTLTAVSAATILAAGFLIPNHAEALIGAPGTASLAAQAVAPVENVVWCGWRCHRFHHRAFFFHHRPVFAFHRFHHRPFFHRRWGDGADAAAAVSAANNASDVNGVKTMPPIADGMA